MKCIFCEMPSHTSKSVEHILPESLGNYSHILPRGIVCGSCNNYFSRKIEKKLLESGYFLSLRFSQGLLSKKGRIPAQKVILSPNIELEMVRKKTGQNIVRVPTQYWDQISSQKKGMIIFQTSGPKPSQVVMSRFLAKVAVEFMAQRLIGKEGLILKMIEDEQLDPIRGWARYGISSEVWQFSERRIYETNKKHSSDAGENYQVIFEYDFLVTNHNEVYFCLAIFGQEFTINMGGPSIEGYLQWLSENGHKSPLFHGKNH